MVERLIPQHQDLGEPTASLAVRFLVYGLGFIVVAAAGIGLLYAIVKEEQKFSAIYERLGLEALPKNIENMPYIKADLVKLQEGPCDKVNVESLAQSLDNLGQLPLAQSVRKGFTASCTGPVQAEGFEPTLDALSANSTDGDIRRLARVLRGSPCTYASIKDLIGKLQSARAHQPATQIGEGYLARCQRNIMVAYWTMQSYFQLGDHVRSLALTQEFEQVEPNDAYWPYWKGRNFSALGRTQEAADAHVRSLGLWSNPAKVVINDFWVTSQALKAAGRYCQAVQPLQQYVSFDPVSRATPQMQQEITALARLGNCP